MFGESLSFSIGKPAKLNETHVADAAAYSRVGEK
jgi:hypothetical protein